MNIVYRVEWQDKTTGCNVSYIESKAAAYSVYRRKKNEKLLKTEWAEIWATDYDDENGDWELLEGFEREQMEVMGYQMFTGRKAEY